MPRLSIELTPDEHKKIKILASYEGKKIRNFVLDKVFGKKSRVPKFKAATLKAIKDAEMGKNLIMFDSVEALFEELLK